MIAALYVGRKLGWALSRSVLYAAPGGVAALACILWGCVVAFAVRAAVTAYQPHIILKVIAYLEGAYLAIPNYGLIAPATIPPDGVGRHGIVSNVPLAVYVGSALLLAFLW